jgi:hypothetical protein
VDKDQGGRSSSVHSGAKRVACGLFNFFALFSFVLICSLLYICGCGSIVLEVFAISFSINI